MPAPLITLTTDIGTRDHLVGAIKGQLMQAIPFVQVVDISHGLAPWNFLNAAYICKSTLPYFEAGTIHVALVSVFEQQRSELVIVKHKDQYIVCPNNGLATMILGFKPTEYMLISQSPEEGYFNLLSFTHQMARSLAQLVRRQLSFHVDGQGGTLVEKYPLRPTIGPDWIEGQIIYIDQFENVVANITRLEFETQRAGRNISIQFARHTITHLSTNYASVQPGEMIAWFNSSGYLELALNKGNIAGLIGLQGIGSGALVDKTKPTFYYSTVRIYFIEPPAQQPG